MFHKLVMKISNNIVWGNLEKKYTGLAENAKYRDDDYGMEDAGG